MTRFSTQLIVDVDETDEGYELAVRFGPEDLEWSGNVSKIDDNVGAILGNVIAQAIIDEIKTSRLARRLSAVEL